MTIGILTHTGAGGVDGATTPAIDTSGATLLVMAFAWWPGGNPTPAIGDSKSNTWTPMTVIDASGELAMRFWYVASPTVGLGHTFNFSGVSAYGGLTVCGFSGTKLALPWDGQEVSGASDPQSSPLTLPSLTPVQANSLVVTAAAFDNDSSSMTGVTGAALLQREEGNTGQACHFAAIVQTARVACTPAWSWTSGPFTVVGVSASFQSDIPLYPGGDEGPPWWYLARTFR
jgi:hypothetical protein